MRLYLIRHPKPDIDAGICYGRSDPGLAEDAAERAEALRELLPAAAPLYTSPLRRCLDLALALHAAPAIDARLMEIHFGEWELRRWDDIPRHQIDAWAADPVGYAPPGGESPAAMRARVASLLAELPEVAVLVAHGGVLRACVAELTGAAGWHEMHFDYGSASLIENGRLIWKNRRDAD
ncbi:MAG: histidine phosphatase family protein [Rhodocyclaceae bacterium]|nr:histidine phosphatase family protein [Rhodocyclaceae bacterium]MBK6554537.1 histidine phosphatase family protein [Rhodocyclaceae bacterium]MBK6677526.1 histidine phosphatase family protein [Rhodocyclaceae bacterium]MBK9310184.1 histidine phosphatase family protein [Rhodocyclaceae bacterium]MBK9954743.1 histidine phosphatase family protein [Rhodocyclaceae bacterium]